jgi:protein-disulfide isomerase
VIRDTLMNVVTGLMVLSALTVTGLLARRELGSPGASPSGFVVQSEPAWREYAAVGHRIGPANAPVTITEFGDFECPACRHFDEQLRTVRLRHPGEIALVYRHFPVRTHRFAVAAARASECADAQGRFEAMHDTLFANPDSLGVVPWTWYAERAGVPDTAAFAVCARASGQLVNLAADTMAARKLKLRGTPTVLVNDLRFTGSPPLDSIEAIVARARKAAGHTGG